MCLRDLHDSELRCKRVPEMTGLGDACGSACRCVFASWCPQQRGSNCTGPLKRTTGIDGGTDADSVMAMKRGVPQSYGSTLAAVEQRVAMIAER